MHHNPSLLPHNLEITSKQQTQQHRESYSSQDPSGKLSVGTLRTGKIDGMERVMKLASERAVVIFTLGSCCMCSTVTGLICDQLGVNALVHELDKDPRGKEMERALLKLLGKGPSVPAVFVGGKLVGETNKVMSLHLGGELVPMLRNAGALWL